MRKKARAKKVYLVRHGEPAEGYTRRFLGRLDPELSEKGREQARRMAGRIVSLSPACCWTSPLRRARETAEIIASACGLRAESRDMLLEVDFGLLEGLTWGEAARLYPGITDSWQVLSSDFHFPGGEDYEGFTRRTGELAEAVRAYAGESMLLVAHGGILRGVLCNLLGIEASGPLRFRFSYAALSILEIFETGDVLLRGFNVGGV